MEQLAPIAYFTYNRPEHTKISLEALKKNELSEKLLEYASDNNLTHKIIEITDGNLKFQTRKQPSALTFTFIEKCLSDCISNEDHVKQILHYIKERRESKYINELKRTYKN